MELLLTPTETDLLLVEDCPLNIKLEKLQFTTHHKICKDCLVDHSNLLLSKTFTKEGKKKLKEIISALKKDIKNKRRDSYTEWLARQEMRQSGVRCKYGYVYTTLVDK